MSIKERLRALEAKRAKPEIELIEIPWEAKDGEPVFWTMLIGGGPMTRQEWEAAYPDHKIIFHYASDDLKAWDYDQSSH